MGPRAVLRRISNILDVIHNSGLVNGQHPDLNCDNKQHVDLGFNVSSDALIGGGLPPVAVECEGTDLSDDRKEGIVRKATHCDP